jgi:hypothetical protein
MVIESRFCHNFKDLEEVKKYKEIIEVDHVLKTNSKYLFCLKIEDAEVVDNIENISE